MSGCLKLTCTATMKYYTKRKRKRPKSPRQLQKDRMHDKFAVLIKLQANMKCVRCNSQYEFNENDKRSKF